MCFFFLSVMLQSIVKLRYNYNWCSLLNSNSILFKGIRSAFLWFDLEFCWILIIYSFHIYKTYITFYFILWNLNLSGCSTKPSCAMTLGCLMFSIETFNKEKEKIQVLWIIREMLPLLWMFWVACCDTARNSLHLYMTSDNSRWDILWGNFCFLITISVGEISCLHTKHITYEKTY